MATYTGYIRRRLKQLVCRRDGGSTVEFALIAAPLMAMFFGLVEFSRYAYVQAALNFAAEEATRFAIAQRGNVTNADIIALAQEKMILIDSGLAAICVRSPIEVTTQTSTVSITIQYSYDPIIPAVFGSLTLAATSEGFISFSPLDPVSEITGDCPEGV